MVEIDFLDIVINADVKPHEFDFVPPSDIHTVDVTNDYLSQLSATPK